MKQRGGTSRPVFSVSKRVINVERSWKPSLSMALDVMIGVCGLALLTILLTGGFDLGWFTATRVAKPLVVLALLFTLRVALTGSLSRFWTEFLLWRLIPARARALVGSVHVPVAARDVLFTLAATRLASVAASFFLLLLFPPKRSRFWAAPFEDTTLAHVFAAWDSRWYFGIAKYGYSFDSEAQSNVAFFPLYPMLIRGVAWLFGSSDRAIFIAGIVVSWAALAAALMVLHRFTERCTGSRETARRAILYLSVFPFSFFYDKIYAESLFLLVTVLAVAAAHRGRWTQAGVYGALAALTRPNGILIAVPLVCFALADRPTVRELVRRTPALCLPLGGLALYCLYLFQLTGNPLAWLSAQEHWAYSLGHPPGEQLIRMIGKMTSYGVYNYFLSSDVAPLNFFHGSAALLFLLLTPHVFTRLGAAFGAYVLASLLVPLTSNALEGLGRYCAVLFPVFMVLGGIRSERMHEVILIVCCLLLACFAGLFVTLHPIY